MLIVDSQIHLWRNDAAPPHHRQVPYSPQDAIRDMDEAGVARAVNCPPIWDPSSNEFAVDAARAYPGRLATMGWFPLNREPDHELMAGWRDRPGMLGLRFVLATPAQQAAFEEGALEWIWSDAEAFGLPVSLALPGHFLPRLGSIAAAHPGLRLSIDHLGAAHAGKLPEAFTHIDLLLDLARLPNVAVKASAIPAYATDPYPFVSMHPLLRRVFDRFGPHRFFWGTDITRMTCTWRECVTMFTQELPWLSRGDKELVMGKALCAWIGWKA